jgi:ribonuclease-3
MVNYMRGSSPAAEERIKALRDFEADLSCRFKDIGLLNTALIHRSFMNENPSESFQDNERLEFLGDAVLGLCISDLLMKSFPRFSEGQLSRLRAAIVNEQSLAEFAGKFKIGDYLLLGRGEESSGGRSKTSILSNAFEALIAAIYLDCGFEGASSFVKNTFTPVLEAQEAVLIYADSKTALQEFTQSRYKETPQYSLIAEYGPDHDKTFEVRLSVANIVTVGRGKSKKEAEQRAAKKALEEFDRSRS